MYDIEILPPNRRILNRKFCGIIDTGADVTMIDVSLVGEYELSKTPNFELKLKILELFGDEILIFNSQIFKITENNNNDVKPDILLGRDFLKRCVLTYNGLTNQVDIESFEK